MTLRNAFDNLGTESALRRIANLLTFARDSADRIRVAVDSGSIVVYARGTSTNIATDTTGTPFLSTMWNAQDARETQRITMRPTADFVRKNRWTY